jgi:hypothetical protein
MVAFSVLPLVRVLVTGGCLADGLVARETAASQMDKCSVCASDYLVRRYFIATLERSFVGHTHTRGVLARSVTIYLRCSRAMRTECILRPCGSF